MRDAVNSAQHSATSTRTHAQHCRTQGTCLLKLCSSCGGPVMGVDLCGWCAFRLACHIWLRWATQSAEAQVKDTTDHTFTTDPPLEVDGLPEQPGLLCTAWVVPPGRVGCRGFHCSVEVGAASTLPFSCYLSSLPSLQFKYLSCVAFFTVLALLSDEIAGEGSLPSGRRNSGTGVPVAVSRPCQRREESGHRGRIGDNGCGVAAVYDLYGPRLPLYADLLVRRAFGRGPEPSSLRTRRTTGSRSVNSLRQASCRAVPPWNEYINGTDAPILL